MNKQAYYINVNQNNIQDFIKIIESLKSLGVITSFEAIKDLIKEGKPLSSDELISIVTKSQSEIKEGQFYSHDEAKQLLNEWMKKK